MMRCYIPTTYFPFSFFPIMQHIFRSRTVIGEQRKSISFTDRVVTMNTHFPELCLPNEQCQLLLVDPEVGLLNHYRYY